MNLQETGTYMLAGTTNQTLIYAGLLLVGLAFMFVIARLLDRRREHEWSRAARHLGLKFSKSDVGPAMSGKIDGRSVEYRVSPESSDTGGGVVVARGSVAVGGHPVGMRAEAVPGLIGDLTNLAEERFMTGDELFDRNVHVQGEPPAALRDFWTPHRRQVFLKMVEAQNYDRLLLADNQLIAEVRGASSDHQQVENLLRQLLKTSQGLERSHVDSARE